MLRKSDPRFVALLEFCDSRPELLASPIVQMVKKVFVAVLYHRWRELDVRLNGFDRHTRSHLEY